RPMSRPRKQTGPDGRFEFRGLASGDYTLVASKRGYSRDRIDPVKVAEGRGGEAFELVLKPGATISGFVKDRGGNGVPGYRLAARPSGAVSGPMMGPFGGPLTDEPTGADGSFLIEGPAAGRGPGQMASVPAEDGRFELDDVPAGKWDVEATASGYQRGRAAGIGVEEGGSAEGVEVRLTRGAAILGRVLESRSGRPV